MRLLHTSDWHLGRLFHGVHLTDDQAHVLDQLVDLVENTRPHAVLIAGDIYDRAVPPPEAVALLDETLSRIAVDLRTPVVLIAGNHDSPDRIGFGARMMAGQGVHIFGTMAGAISAAPAGTLPGVLELAPQMVEIEDEHGPVSIVPLPYAEPAAVRGALHSDSFVDHRSAIAALTNAAHGVLPAGRRAVVMAHVFVTGGAESESERPLSVGGTGSVDVASFQGFSYCALGHLHRPQSAGVDNVRYSGSLLKYAFAEADHHKSVSMVEINHDGRASIEEIELSPRRDVRVVKGSLEQILTGSADDGNRDDYIMAELTDRGAILEAMSRIRAVYPNCMHIDRSAFLAHSGQATGSGPADHRSRSHEELFGDFISDVTGEKLNDAELSAFHEVLDSMRSGEREDAA
jgi:exonuclease SbcD